MRDGCTEFYGNQFDERYNKIGEYQISEYNLQDEAEVLDLVKTHGHNTSWRKSVMFSLWTRPTIPFKLECESEFIKQDIASQISKIVQIIDGYGSE